MDKEKSAPSYNIITTHLESDVCMMRSVDGSPVSLRPLRHNAQSVEIEPLGRAHERPLWFPREIVLRFDKDLFVALDRAFHQANFTELDRLWQRAEKWETTQN